ncbi:calcium-transporting, partial [Cystoisospora suis]
TPGGGGGSGSPATAIPSPPSSFSSSSSFSGHHRAFQHIKENDYSLQWFCRCATLCNEAQLEIPPGTDGTKFTRLGEPTEAALLVLVEKLGCSDDTLNSRFLQCPGRTPQLPMPF